MSIVRLSNVFDPFSLDLWDPFSLAEPRADPRVGWKETPEAHMLKADLPSVKKEEVKVEVEDGRILKISGERDKEEHKNDMWHRAERSIGEFLRRFRMPENARVEEAKASMENGVLTVTLPKEEVKQPGVKPIEIIGA